MGRAVEGVGDAGAFEVVVDVEDAAVGREDGDDEGRVGHGQEDGHDEVEVPGDLSRDHLSGKRGLRLMSLLQRLSV